MTHTELFGSAHWVAPSAPCSQPYLRSAFTASGVEDASITISGLGFFELYCNGKRVSPDLLVPAWTDYEPHVFAHCIGGNPVRETRTGFPPMQWAEILCGKPAATGFWLCATA